MDKYNTEETRSELPHKNSPDARRAASELLFLVRATSYSTEHSDAPNSVVTVMAFRLGGDSAPERANHVSALREIKYSKVRLASPGLLQPKVARKGVEPKPQPYPMAMPIHDDKRLRLAGNQLELHRALTAKRADCGTFYLSAVAILNDAGLPDRIAMVAHALRELMEKLPNETKLDEGADLNTRVIALQAPWKQACREEQERGGDKWTGPVGNSLRAFLTTAKDFFKHRDQIVAGRKELARRFLDSLDVGNIGLPDDIQRKNADAWMKLRKYFTGVAHHTITPDDPEFSAQVAQLEAFLYARLVPRPVADFAMIDALLREE